jgi:hypothetical protein
LEGVKIAVLFGLVLAYGCKTGGQEELAPSAPAPTGGVRWLRAPEGGDVAPLVQKEQANAAANHRRLVVYVGAVWCEPCQMFHHAAERGDLDSTFPELTLLEFDIDHDRERLAVAGYASRYIPLFALPKQDGTASGRQVEGGIKGDGAVGYVTAKVKDLLASQ